MKAARPSWPPVAEIARRIERELAAHAIPERIAFLTSGYAPSRLRYLGCTVPDLRREVGRWSRVLKTAPPAVLRELALQLVKRGTVEGRQVGYELMARRRDVMRELSPALVRRLGRGIDNWASVDGFAAYVSGPAWRDGIVDDQEVLKWARSKDRWWRRTALSSAIMLNVRSRGGRGDATRTLRICREFARETDPMLAKALSWALRSAIAFDAPAVRAFLARHEATLPRLVLREVGTKLRTGLKREPRPPA